MVFSFSFDISLYAGTLLFIFSILRLICQKSGNGLGIFYLTGKIFSFNSSSVYAFKSINSSSSRCCLRESDLLLQNLNSVHCKATVVPQCDQPFQILTAKSSSLPPTSACTYNSRLICRIQRACRNLQCITFQCISDIGAPSEFFHLLLQEQPLQPLYD